ncbi:MAG: hypothetical protein HY741_07520 [Chloroflexi bacterium]|nr:hypothetical protein [Chloroflexota bacterium]
MTHSAPPNTPRVPGPTAQFEKILPIEEWSTYTDELAGFRIAYPPDWYVNGRPPNLPPQGWTTQFLSYDPNDRSFAKGKAPSNIIKLEITLDDLEVVGHPFAPGQSLEDWVHGNSAISPDFSDQLRLIEESPMTIAGVSSFRQVIEYHTVDHFIGVTIYVPRGRNMIYINYRLPDTGSYQEQILRQMIESIQFFP